MRAHAKSRSVKNFENKKLFSQFSSNSLFMSTNIHIYIFVHIEEIFTPKIINSNLTDFIVSNLRADKY